MRIAIFDVANQDIGLKIIFPEADYYVGMIERDKSSSYEKYNIEICKDAYNNINDKNYDCVFIICSLYDILVNTKFYKPAYRNIYSTFVSKVIDNNKFNHVCLFDNYDYDYDPSKIDITNKINFYFKRNYDKTKTYSKNVFPYPLIMFGDKSIIEILDYDKTHHSEVEKIDRVFFSGTIFNHIDEQYGVYRSRYILQDLLYELDMYASLSYEEYMKKMCMYKFSLDLLGVGDPNKRTFEILASGSLRIAQRNNLRWPCDMEFCEETLFSTTEEFYKKMKILKNNPEIYKKCLDRQEQIYKYFTKSWCRDYINTILEQGLFYILDIS